MTTTVTTGRYAVECARSLSMSAEARHREELFNDIFSRIQKLPFGAKQELSWFGESDAHSVWAEELLTREGFTVVRSGFSGELRITWLEDAEEATR